MSNRKRGVLQMQEENYPTDVSSQPEFDAGETEETRDEEQHDNMSAQDEVDNKPVIPAKLPSYSQAAIAQRPGTVPARPTDSFTYDAPQRRLHPAGWRTRRHIKR